MTRSRTLYLIASLSFGGVLLWYSLRGIDWQDVWSALRVVRPSLAEIAFILISLNLLVRAMRWRVLLAREGAVPIGLAFWSTAAGYLCNNLLPARAGEIVRTLMVSRSARLNKTFVLTTALAERVADAIALLAISASVLLSLHLQSGWLATAARPFALLAIAGAAIIALFPACESIIFRSLDRVVVLPKLREQVELALRHGIRAFRTLHSPGRLMRFSLLTAIIWSGDAVASTICARSINVSIGLPVAFLLIAGLGLGSALPSTPGYIGIYQFVAVNVLRPFGVNQADAVAFILVLQLVNYLVVLLWGLIGMAWQAGLISTRSRRIPDL